MRILIVEPYYGGSHRTFLTGLMRTVEAEYVVISLPARSWKRRMQLAAPWVADKIREIPTSERRFDTVLCSSFLDVALLRSMTQTIVGWNGNALFCTYFHENQFAYPARFADTSIFQFCYLNFTSALASDRVAFNSRFNRDTFFQGCCAYLNRSHGAGINETVEQMKKKSVVLYPGIDFQGLENRKDRIDDVPVIVWNHRWEHDKGPEDFFNGLNELEQSGVEYKLLMLGQEFSGSSGYFEEQKRRFEKRIAHWGYVENRDEYMSFLQLGDIVVSTARHEFFGIAVLEAVRAGCRPLLPDRLSYPELFPDEYLYKDDEFHAKLHKMCVDKVRLNVKDSESYTKPYEWEYLRQEYTSWLGVKSPG